MTFSDTVYGRYMKKHPGFFSRREIVAAFLTGCYVNTVCYKQKEEREMKSISQAPFAKKFQGRLLSRNRLQRLFQEVHDKLAVYNSLGLVINNDLESELAQAWVACEDRWDISNEEATFAFTIGYCLGYRLGTGKYDSDEGKQEDKG